MPAVDLHKAPTDVLIAALAHGREPQIYTEGNGIQIQRPNITDYLVAITGQDLSAKAKLIIASGYLPSYLREVEQHPKAALKIIAQRIQDREEINIPLMRVDPLVLSRLVSFTDPHAPQQQFETFLATGEVSISPARIFEEAKKIKPNWASGQLTHYVRMHQGLASVITEAYALAACPVAQTVISRKTLQKSFI